MNAACANCGKAHFFAGLARPGTRRACRKCGAPFLFIEVDDIPDPTPAGDVRKPRTYTFENSGRELVNLVLAYTVGAALTGYALATGEWWLAPILLLAALWMRNHWLRIDITDDHIIVKAPFRSRSWRRSEVVGVREETVARSKRTVYYVVLTMEGKKEVRLDCPALMQSRLSYAFQSVIG